MGIDDRSDPTVSAAEIQRGVSTHDRDKTTGPAGMRPRYTHEEAVARHNWQPKRPGQEPNEEQRTDSPNDRGA